MPKRVVVCCDGTWNTADQKNENGPTPTNVVKIATSVAAMDSDGVEQRVFYHPGVGTRPGERLMGGLFAFGLSRDIRETYRFLVQTFEPGDELYFFGFSRGAFTARSTVGFIHNCGILRREHADRVDEAYALYRSRRERTKPKSTEAQLFRRSYSHETGIRFIGVWDTVGSLGIPFDGLRLANLVNRRRQFHDTKLNPTVESAFQALAIDEQRRPFKPTLWSPPSAGSGTRLEQMWFAGVHSDIGGGYKSSERALADISLRWLVDRAAEWGLAFNTDTLGLSSYRDPFGKLHTSRTGFYRLIAPLHRPIGKTDAAHEYAACTATTRRARMSDYRPAKLIAYLDHGGRNKSVRLPAEQRQGVSQQVVPQPAAPRSRVPMT